MNPSHHTQVSAAEDQAALWAARLDGGELAPADRAALESWLAASPAHAALLASYREISSQLEVRLPQLLDEAEADAEADHLLVLRRARRRFASVSLAAAGLAVAAGLALAIWLRGPAAAIQDIATPAGQRQHFTLADGTQVELNARTRLEVENGRGERVVKLAQGEVYFIVKKDKSRPFIVETPAGNVRVTGTTFDVRTESASELDVTVVEGSVQVRPGTTGEAGPHSAFLLTRGKTLSARPDGISVAALSSEELDDALAWRDGAVVFHGAPLGEALAEFARYHGTAIEVSPAAAARRIGGRFSLDDLDKFYTALQDVMPDVRVARAPDGLTRVELRTKR